MLNNKLSSQGLIAVPSRMHLIASQTNRVRVSKHPPRRGHLIIGCDDRSEVTVRPTDVIAAEQIKVEEKQRFIGVIPNFYISYVHDPAP
jgi:hypothetical protein